MLGQRIETFFISVNHARPFSVGTNWAFSVAQIKHSVESMVMVINVYKDPVRMVDFVSALALRQVGYAIPTDLVGPFMSACVEAGQGLTKDAKASDDFQWSLAMVSRSLTRTILEGSTFVMKAVSCAFRGDHDDCTLRIKVWTQSVSPPAWSIENGLESTSARIKVLITFRSQREIIINKWTTAVGCEVVYPVRRWSRRGLRPPLSGRHVGYVGRWSRLPRCSRGQRWLR